MMNDDSDYDDSTTGTQYNDKEQERYQKGSTYHQAASAEDDKKRKR